MSKLGKSLPVNVDKIKSEAGSEVVGSLGVSFPTNVGKLKSELGGGSGETTSVTLTCGVNVRAIVGCPYVENGVYKGLILGTGEGSKTYEVLIGQGGTIAALPVEQFGSNLQCSVNGNATFTDDEGIYFITITGACQITLSAPK